MIIGSDRGENYNFQMDNKLITKHEMKVKQNTKGYISKYTCTQVLKVDTQPADI